MIAVDENLYNYEGKEGENNRWRSKKRKFSRESLPALLAIL